jgi:hypothetical protein
MRFMILVRASPASESGVMPAEKQIAEQLAFHQATDEAGVLIDAMGFHPTAKAWRVLQRTDGSREVIEGPFHDDHLIAGYTLIDVGSREDAMEWSLRYAKTALEDEDGEIEVRQLFDLDESAPSRRPGRASRSCSSHSCWPGSPSDAWRRLSMRPSPSAPQPASGAPRSASWRRSKALGTSPRARSLG